MVWTYIQLDIIWYRNVYTVQKGYTCMLYNTSMRHTDCSQYSIAKSYVHISTAGNHCLFIMTHHSLEATLSKLEAMYTYECVSAASRVHVYMHSRWEIGVTATLSVINWYMSRSVGLMLIYQVKGALCAFEFEFGRQARTVEQAQASCSATEIVSCYAWGITRWCRLPSNLHCQAWFIQLPCIPLCHV